MFQCDAGYQPFNFYTAGETIRCAVDNFTVVAISGFLTLTPFAAPAYGISLSLVIRE